jgi:hypothetical protein
MPVSCKSNWCLSFFQQVSNRRGCRMTRSSNLRVYKHHKRTKTTKTSQSNCKFLKSRASRSHLSNEVPVTLSCKPLRSREDQVQALLESTLISKQEWSERVWVVFKELKSSQPSSAKRPHSNQQPRARESVRTVLTVYSRHKFIRTPAAW